MTALLLSSVLSHDCLLFVFMTDQVITIVLISLVLLSSVLSYDCFDDLVLACHLTDL